MDVSHISKADVRLVPGGFAWEIQGKDSESGQRVTITIRFDFAWFSPLANLLARTLEMRDAETTTVREKAIQALRGDH